MKNIVYSLFILALLGAGCTSTPMDNTQDMERPLHLSQPTKIEMTTEAQDAIFYIGTGWTGGMGSARVMDDNGPFDRGDYPVYLQEDMVDEVLSMDGGLPSCVYGDPIIKIWANISLVKQTDTNYSMGVPEEMTYYEAQINHLSDVLIEAESCEE